MSYKYIDFLKKQLNKTRLNILILSVNQLTTYVNLNFKQNNCFIIYKTELELNTIIHKYKAYEITVEQLTNILFDIVVANNPINYIDIIKNINTTYCYCKNNTYVLTNYTKISEYLYIKKKNNNNNNIPLIIRNKNRLLNLYFTLNSLYTTNAPDLCNILISDDCSTDKQMIQFLNTNNRIKYQIDYQKANNKFINNQWIQNIAETVNKTQYVNGIKNKVNIHFSNKSHGDRGGMLYNIKLGFQNNPYTDIIIIIQNDIVFNKEWLNKMLQIYNKIDKSTLGIITCFNRPNNVLVKPEKIDNYLKSNKGFYVGAQCYLISRNLYNILLKQNVFNKKFKDIVTPFDKKIASSYNDYNIAGDTYILEYMYKNNLNIYVTENSYIQHIGNSGSSCRFWKSPPLIIANNFVKPISYKQIF